MGYGARAKYVPEEAKKLNLLAIQYTFIIVRLTVCAANRLEE